MNATQAMGFVRRARARTEPLTVPWIIFAIYCYFVVDYFARFSARIPGYGSLRPTLLIVALLTVALWTQFPKIKHAFDEKPLRIILFLLLYLLLSLPLVTWPGSVVKNNLDTFFKAIVFIFFTATIIDTDRRLKIFVALFVGLQMFRVLEPLLTYMVTGNLSGRTYVGGGEFEGRLSGASADVINPNGLGFVIVTTLAYMHFMMGGSPSRIIRWLYFGLTPLFLYALVLTASRGAFITFLVLAAFIFLDSKRKVLLVVLAVTTVVIVLPRLSDFHQARYQSILVHDDSALGRTAHGRFEGMIGEFRLGLKRPVFGHGLGTTPEAKVNQLGSRNRAAHNLYAELLIEIGFIGAAIFMAYLLSLYKFMQSNLRAFKKAVAEGSEIDSFQLRLNKALLTVFWVYAVYSINYYGLSQEYWYLFGGLCIAFARSIQRSRAENEAGVFNQQHSTSPAGAVGKVSA